MAHPHLLRQPPSLEDPRSLTLPFTSPPPAHLPLLLGPANVARLPLLLHFHPPPSPPGPLLTPAPILPGATIGAEKMMIFFSASNAMNDYDPVGNMLHAKCSDLFPRFKPAGLTFLNFNALLRPDAHVYLHLRLLHRLDLISPRIRIKSCSLLIFSFSLFPLSMYISTSLPHFAFSFLILQSFGSNTSLTRPISTFLRRAR